MASLLVFLSIGYHPQSNNSCTCNWAWPSDLDTNSQNALVQLDKH